MTDREVVFVAYPSRDPNLAEMVMDAVRRANALPLPVLYQPWSFNDVPGNPLVSPILERIDESPFVIADITYLNLNVVYEIGFTIGRCKRAFLVRHLGTDGDKDISNAVGIFDTLGYHEYENSENLKDRLAAHIESTHLTFSTALNRNSPVYLIEPPNRGDDVGVMASRIKKAGYGRYRSFTPEEDARLSAVDAIRQVAASSAVFIPFQTPTIQGATIHNIRCMFIAGLADGMGKPKLILVPSGYDAPLDVRDDAKIWYQLADIHDHVAQFCPSIVEYEGRVEPSGIDRMTLLQSLRVRPETLCRITEFSEHELNGRELDEGERVAVEVLPVLGQSAAAVEPGDGAFDHPTPGLDDEALHPIGSLDDLGLEIGQDAGQGAVKDRPLIGAVGEQFPEKGKQTEQGRQQRETAVAILNVGGGDDAVQQQALRIDQNMPLLALDQLAGIEAVAVDASPPFSSLFTL